MQNKIKIGIIICDRYKNCAGGKCFRALRDREGAFDIYKENGVELVGYITCGGCPGGNIEYSPEEMIKNGVQVIHLATGFIVGYPPCPYIQDFKNVIEKKYGLTVQIGTHPIPQKYYKIHTALKSWNSPELQKLISHTITNEQIRLAYD